MYVLKESLSNNREINESLPKTIYGWIVVETVAFVELKNYIMYNYVISQLNI